MTQPDIIQTILKDSNYHLDLFTDPDEDIVFASSLVRINPDPEIVTPEYLKRF